jgi:hypothetical protein
MLRRSREARDPPDESVVAALIETVVMHLAAAVGDLTPIARSRRAAIATGSAASLSRPALRSRAPNSTSSAARCNTSVAAEPAGRRHPSPVSHFQIGSFASLQSRPNLTVLRIVGAAGLGGTENGALFGGVGLIAGILRGLVHVRPGPDRGRVVISRVLERLRRGAHWGVVSAGVPAGRGDTRAPRLRTRSLPLDPTASVCAVCACRGRAAGSAF